MHRFAAVKTLSLCCVLHASPSLAQKCEAAKLLAFGKHYSCVIGAQAKAVKKTGKVASPGQPVCGDKLTASWAKADALGGCPSTVTAGDAILDSTARTDALSDALAPGAPAVSACSSFKLKSAGKYSLCRLKVQRANVLSAKPLDFTKCEAKLTSSFAKAEALAAADCLTSADVEGARTQVTTDADEIAALLTGTTTTTTNTTTSTLDDGLDDTFDGVALDPAWTVLNPSVATISVSGGQLHVQIDTLTNWFNNIESVLVYKDVTGDFDVHTTLQATKTSTSDPAEPEYRLGGLLARNPASSPADSDFVHVALGTASMGIGPAAEDKTTIDSGSTFFFYAIPDTEGELRLTRVGSNFSMYYRPVGDPTWQLLNSHMRADLPATLQVGMMAYDFNASPDFTMHFDEVVFE